MVSYQGYVRIETEQRPVRVCVPNRVQRKTVMVSYRGYVRIMLNTGEDVPKVCSNPHTMRLNRVGEDVLRVLPNRSNVQVR